MGEKGSPKKEETSSFSMLIGLLPAFYFPFVVDLTQISKLSIKSQPQSPTKADTREEETEAERINKTQQEEELLPEPEESLLPATRVPTINPLLVG